MQKKIFSSVFTKLKRFIFSSRASNPICTGKKSHKPSPPVPLCPSLRQCRPSETDGRRCQLFLPRLLRTESVLENLTSWNKNLEWDWPKQWMPNQYFPLRGPRLLLLTKLQEVQRNPRAEERRSAGSCASSRAQFDHRRSLCLKIVHHQRSQKIKLTPRGRGEVVGAARCWLLEKNGEMSRAAQQKMLTRKSLSL